MPLGRPSMEFRYNTLKLKYKGEKQRTRWEEGIGHGYNLNKKEFQIKSNKALRFSSDSPLSIPFFFSETSFDTYRTFIWEVFLWATHFNFD